jgi:hypothetical protein
LQNGIEASAGAQQYFEQNQKRSTGGLLFLFDLNSSPAREQRNVTRLQKNRK